MRVRLLMNVENDLRGAIVHVTAERGEKLIRTGYAELMPEKKVKED